MPRGRPKDVETKPRNSNGAKLAALLAGDLEMVEDSDAYLAEHISWVPKEARGSHLQANATHPTIGKPVRVLRAPLFQPGAPVSERYTSGLAA